MSTQITAKMQDIEEINCLLEGLSVSLLATVDAIEYAPCSFETYKPALIYISQEMRKLQKNLNQHTNEIFDALRRLHSEDSQSKSPNVWDFDADGKNNAPKNLLAEMEKANVSISDIQKCLDIPDQDVAKKLSGEEEFTLLEAFKIINAFFKGMSLDYIFE